MKRLIDLGWSSRLDTFETYYKSIDDYQIFVGRHIEQDPFWVTLIYHECEIIVNYDADFDWVVSLDKLLSNADREVCCHPTSGFYLGTTCPKCNRPFRMVLNK